MSSSLKVSTKKKIVLLNNMPRDLFNNLPAASHNFLQRRPARSSGGRTSSTSEGSNNSHANIVSMDVDDEDYNIIDYEANILVNNYVERLPIYKTDLNEPIVMTPEKLIRYKFTPLPTSNEEWDRVVGQGYLYERMNRTALEEINRLLQIFDTKYSNLSPNDGYSIMYSTLRSVHRDNIFMIRVNAVDENNLTSWSILRIA
tara:strand:- start:1788 stop:2390 length:603 start_codon:yes stop_codon:yes gene_type:complete